LKDKLIIMSNKDNVAIAIDDIISGENLTVNIQGTKNYHFKSRDNINFGHKIAFLEIKKNEEIIKCGEVIGIATQLIHQGDHVHIHNVKSKRGKKNYEN